MNNSKVEKINDTIDELEGLLKKADGQYSNDDKEHILKALTLLKEYKESGNESLLVGFFASLLRAFLIHELFENDWFKDHFHF